MKIEKPYTYRRTVVTVKYTTGLSTDDIIRDVESPDSVIVVDPTRQEILSMTITETARTTISPEHIAKRKAAIRAAREARELVYSADPRRI